MAQGLVDAAAAPAARSYVLNQPRFAFRQWPEGCVVHDEADGSLYELTAAAGEALALLGSRATGLPLSVLAEALLDGAPEPGDLDLVQHLLAQLCELGIVRVASA